MACGFHLETLQFPCLCRGESALCMYTMTSSDARLPSPTPSETRQRDCDVQLNCHCSDGNQQTEISSSPQRMQHVLTNPPPC